jgi:D-glycero-alpha-D-manno-heptose-7-phosphate kinase
MIIAKTPLRISLFGGGTDFPEYFSKNNGLVVGSSIDKYIYHSVSSYSKKLFGHSIRFAYSKIEYVKNINQIQHKPFKEILKFLNQNGEIEVNLASDLPSFSGMGSSSSFTIGLINAINNFKKNGNLSKKELAKLGIHIERNILNEMVGFQDQIFAAYGGFNAVYFKGSDFYVRKIKIKQERLDKLNKSLALIYTGQKRKAVDIEKSKFNVLTDKKINNLNKIYEIAKEALSILDKNKNIDNIGVLLDENWKTKKKLSNVVSNPDIDNIYSSGLKFGAIGGKLLGAGGGGFILFYVPEKKMNYFKGKMSRYHIIDVKLDSQGSSII